MNEVQIKVSRIMLLMDEVSSRLDRLNFETFDLLFSEILVLAKESKLLREESVQKYGGEKLVSYNPEMFSKAKLIERKYDNIIEIFSREEKRLEKELSGVVSKKKITNYLRY